MGFSNTGSRSIPGYGIILVAVDKAMHWKIAERDSLTFIEPIEFTLSGHVYYIHGLNDFSIVFS
jgi:hypothetical protein